MCRDVCDSATVGRGRRRMSISLLVCLPRREVGRKKVLEVVLRLLARRGDRTGI